MVVRSLLAILSMILIAAACAATSVSTPPSPTNSTTNSPTISPPQPSALATTIQTPEITASPTLPPTASPTVAPTSLPTPTPTHAATPTPTPTANPTTTPTPTLPPATSPPPTTTLHLKGACLSQVNEPYQEFDRYLLLDASFDEENMKAIQVAMTGANNDQPADGQQPLRGLWQVTLGLDQGTKASDLSFILADAALANDNVESFIDALRESIGSMENLRPNHSVGDSCGGF